MKPCPKRRTTRVLPAGSATRSEACPIGCQAMLNGRTPRAICASAGWPYHRTLYVFACVNPPCWTKQGRSVAGRLCDPKDAGGPAGEPAHLGSAWAMDSDGTVIAHRGASHRCRVASRA